MTRLTDHFAHGVEQTGDEVSITLIVDGTLVSGLLTSVSRYDRWRERIAGVLAATGNGQFDASTEPPTEAEKAWIRGAFEDAVGGPVFVNDLERVAPLLDRIAIRDAFIFAQLGGRSWVRAPYLCINADKVSAVTFGLAGDA